jgi:hypothetical protein
MNMPNIRNLIVGGVSMVKCKVRRYGPAILAARNRIETALEENGYLAEAPFRTVSLIVRFGTYNNPTPEIGEIDERRSFLPVDVELDANHLATIDSEALEQHFYVVMIEVLCDVAANYDLPFEFLDARRPQA